MKNIERLDNYVWVIENNEGEIVGFADTSRSEKMAHQYTYNLTSLYILPSYQGRGWGSALVQEIFEFYKERQAETVHVGVLKDNPAKQFYTYLGAEKVKTMSIDFAGELIDEVILKWDSLDGVLEKLKYVRWFQKNACKNWIKRT